MKKSFKYAFMSAIAFAGAVSFTACQSSDEIVDNPDFNPENNSVKTAITMNVGRGSGVTRMASTVTQNGQPFRGMYKVFIYPATIGNGTTWSAIEDGSSISTPVVSEETIPSTEVSTETSKKTYSGVQVPVGTDNFLFYGRAGSASTAPTTTATKLSNGYTVPTFPTAAGTTEGIKFAAQAIVGATLPDEWNEPVAALAGYLDEIKNAFGTTALTNAAFESYRLDFMKPNTPRAGSAAAVLATAQHLYDVISALTTGLSEAEETIRNNVLDAIEAAPASLSGSTLSWKTDGDLASYTTFPANIGLPLGAAQYQYNPTSGGFVYLITATTSIANTAIVDYIYPSELFYFTNTPLRETNASVTWPTTTETWIADASWTGTWSGSVKATSKNIGLVNNVQYGTAQLATCVKSSPDNENKLYDNSKEKDPTTDYNKAISYANNMFPLTAVLVGAQPSKMGWNFLPSSESSFTKCVYDPNVTGIYANSGDFSALNYTLVYDNSGYDDDQDATTPTIVNVCLEFENKSGVDFYGKDGLIKNDQKFYLIGKLDLANETTTDLGFPTAVGNKNGIYYPSIERRAFIQDYTTTARFTITSGSANDKGSLANALSCIPDLKAVTQEIGLSVDLEWTPGLTFTVNLGE